MITTLRKGLPLAVAGLWALYQLLINFRPDLIYITGQRAIHLFFGLLMFWVLFFLKEHKNKVLKYVTGILGLGFSVVLTVYMLIHGERFDLQPFGYTTLDNIIAIVGILFLLDVTRRVMDWSLTILSVILIVYALYGNYIPGVFGHAGFDILFIAQSMMYTIDGVFGQILGISTSLIYMYLLFGGILLAFGGGEFFTKLALSLVGRTRGGPAKVAVIASGLMGSISGSAISNIATTGSITIPMMKKVGFKPEYAGAVEATSSTGGQILPPVMGAAAFIMADMMGVSYTDVVIAATVPALLYYAAILFMVDFRAAKDGMKGMPRSELPDLKETMKEGWHFLIPFIVLAYLLLVLRWEPQSAAVYAIFAMIIAQLVRYRKLILLIRQIVHGAYEAARNAIVVAIPCATIGIIIGLFMKTGVGLGFASYIRNFAGESIFLMLVLMMIASLLLGLGVPIVAAYIILAVMMVPSLIELGVPDMAAHMFALYYGSLADLTPPVALAAFTAASLAKADPTKTGWWAFLLCFSGFIIPFVFVYQPGLLLIGTPYEIILAVASSFFAVLCLSAVIEGYCLGRMGIVLRLIVAAIGTLCIFPTTTYIGMGLFILFIVYQYLRKKKNQGPVGATA